MRRQVKECLVKIKITTWITPTTMITTIKILKIMIRMLLHTRTCLEWEKNEEDYQRIRGKWTETVSSRPVLDYNNLMYSFPFPPSRWIVSIYIWSSWLNSIVNNQKWARICVSRTQKKGFSLFYTLVLTFLVWEENNSTNKRKRVSMYQPQQVSRIGLIIINLIRSINICSSY